MPPALNLGSFLAMLGQAVRARDLFTRELAACRAAGFTDIVRSAWLSLVGSLVG